MYISIVLILYVALLFGWLERGIDSHKVGTSPASASCVVFHISCSRNFRVKIIFGRRIVRVVSF